MADLKISDLPAAPGVNDAQQFEVNDSGNSRRVTFQQMRDAVTAQADALYAPKTPQHQGVPVALSAVPASWNDLPNQYPYTGLADMVFLSTATNAGPQADTYYYLYHFFHYGNVTQFAIPYVMGSLAWRYRFMGVWLVSSRGCINGFINSKRQIQAVITR